MTERAGAGAMQEVTHKGRLVWSGPQYGAVWECDEDCPASHDDAQDVVDLQPPKRRFVMTLDLHADSMHDLTDKLYDLATDLMHHSAPMSQTGGGASSGHHYEIVENPDMDHDTYATALGGWIDAQSRGEGSGAAEADQQRDIGPESTT